MTSKDLPYSTMNYIQSFVVTYKGKESEKQYIYIFEKEYICVYIL